MRSRLFIALGVLASLPAVSIGQVRTGAERSELIVEAFVNVTAAAADQSAEPARRMDASSVATGFRALGRVTLGEGVDVGARINVSSRDSDVRLTEASVLLFGAGGRLEIGVRMGLPDVLTGYAPNNFTFTGAEFGPASGPSLDPAGGLQLAFLDSGTAAQLAPLTVLGFAAFLFDDISGKVLYVTPKASGFLGGISYAPQADDPRFGELVQLGLTHERYWSQNVLRWGGSYTFARGQQIDMQERYRDLHSVNLGVTATLDDSLMLGAAVTFNGDSGLQAMSPAQTTSSAWGATASINYNTGPWTFGAYYQVARAEGSLDVAGDDRLSALEAGLSYRFHTRMRLYGAWYYYDFTDEGGAGSTTGDANVALLGVRLTL